MGHFGQLSFARISDEQLTGKIKQASQMAFWLCRRLVIQHLSLWQQPVMWILPCCARHWLIILSLFTRTR